MAGGPGWRQKKGEEENGVKVRRSVESRNVRAFIDGGQWAETVKAARHGTKPERA